MAGLISPSMMVYIVENQAKGPGNRAFSGINEGRGKVLRMGAYSEDVLARLRWLNDVMAPVLDAAIRASAAAPAAASTCARCWRKRSTWAMTATTACRPARCSS